jgi:hypothetical protein
VKVGELAREVELFCRILARPNVGMPTSDDREDHRADEAMAAKGA